MFFPILAKSATIILIFYSKKKHHMKLHIFAAYIVAMISLFSGCNKTSAPKTDHGFNQSAIDAQYKVMREFILPLVNKN